MGLRMSLEEQVAEQVKTASDAARAATRQRLREVINEQRLRSDLKRAATLGMTDSVHACADAIVQSQRLQRVHARVAHEMKTLLTALVEVSSHAQLQSMVIKTAGLLARINRANPTADLMHTLQAFRYDVERLNMKQEEVNSALDETAEEADTGGGDEEETPETIASIAMDEARLRREALINPSAASRNGSPQRERSRKAQSPASSSPPPSDRT